MKGEKSWRILLALAAIGSFSGCLFTSKTRLNESQAQNRILSEQNLAQLAEIENLKTHDRDMENNQISSEEEIAVLKDQVEADRRQLANYEREHSALYEQFKALVRKQAQTSAYADPPQTGRSDIQTVR